ncbi:hypothetical protein [Alteriqipengyuania lutimaris]|nr:hypothetical protein [Alteriqipengyuania lutimaris]MBB3032908.1 hypothetical protein [Alteriqipengyuania lutimaris]
MIKFAIVAFCLGLLLMPFEPVTPYGGFATLCFMASGMFLGFELRANRIDYAGGYAVLETMYGAAPVILPVALFLVRQIFAAPPIG